MDAFVNMGNILSSSRCSNGPPRNSILYSNSFRCTVPMTLVLSMGLSVAILILGCLGTYQVSSEVPHFMDGEAPDVLAV